MPQQPRRAHVFISFRNLERDKAFAKAIRTALIDAKFPVWWREDIQCAGEWHGDLDSALSTAGCIVVLWSEESQKSPWVRHEASWAIARDVYAPVRIEPIDMHPPFARLQPTDIPDSDNITKSPGFALLLQRVTKLLPAPLSRAQRFTKYVSTNAGAFVSIAVALTTVSLLAFLGTAVTGQARQLDAQSRRLDKQVGELSKIAPALKSTSDSVKQSTAQIQDLVKPRLTFNARFGISSTEDGYLRLENVGASTASIRSVVVLFDGSARSPDTRSLHSLVPKGHTNFKTVGLSPTDKIGPGRAIPIYTITKRSYEGTEGSSADKQRKDFARKLSIVVVYETPFGDLLSACYNPPPTAKCDA